MFERNLNNLSVGESRCLMFNVLNRDTEGVIDYKLEKKISWKLRRHCSTLRVTKIP